MTIIEFDAITRAQQLQLILAHGILIGHRWQEQVQLDLYCLDGEGTGQGFFVEVNHKRGFEQLSSLRSFPNTTSLDVYAQLIQLPEGWQRTAVAPLPWRARLG